MIPHTFIVRFWRVGQAIESQEFSGPDRRSREGSGEYGATVAGYHYFVTKV